MRAEGWLAADAVVLHAEVAGEGNMNRTLRVRADSQSLVLKQSVPYVAKYPDIEAPIDRDRVEAAFYRTIADDPIVSNAMPRLIGHRPDLHLLCFEDLGSGADYTSSYREGRVGELAELSGWLSALHELRTSNPIFENRAMRALNHAHIFEIPFQRDNGLDLDAVTEGLNTIAATTAANTTLVNRATELGVLYLTATTGVLLHGDFYPGSWIRHPTGAKVIDPEFAFVGPPEFDVGVLRAHMCLSGTADAANLYREPEGFDSALADAFAGIEILRRLLGVAQLPLEADLGQKSMWIEQAMDMVG